MEEVKKIFTTSIAIILVAFGICLLYGNYIVKSTLKDDEALALPINQYAVWEEQDESVASKERYTLLQYSDEEIEKLKQYENLKVLNKLQKYKLSKLASALNKNTEISDIYRKYLSGLEENINNYKYCIKKDDNNYKDIIIDEKNNIGYVIENIKNWNSKYV